MSLHIQASRTVSRTQKKIPWFLPDLEEYFPWPVATLLTFLWLIWECCRLFKQCLTSEQSNKFPPCMENHSIVLCFSGCWQTCGRAWSSDANVKQFVRYSQFSYTPKNNSFLALPKINATFLSLIVWLKSPTRQAVSMVSYIVDKCIFFFQ